MFYNCEGQSHKTVSTDHTFEEKGEPKQTLSLSLSVRVRACIRACVRHERNHCDLDMTGRKDCELHTADTTYFDLDMNDITVT